MTMSLIYVFTFIIVLECTAFTYKRKFYCKTPLDFLGIILEESTLTIGDTSSVSDCPLDTPVGQEMEDTGIVTEPRFFYSPL